MTTKLERSADHLLQSVKTAKVKINDSLELAEELANAFELSAAEVSAWQGKCEEMEKLEEENKKLSKALKVATDKIKYIETVSKRSESDSLKLAESNKKDKEFSCLNYGAANVWEVVKGLMEETQREIKEALENDGLNG